MNIFEHRIVFMGTPAFAAHILEGLLKNHYNIVAVVSQPDKEFGRKHQLKPSETKQMALEYGLPVLCPARIKDEYEEVLSYEPDLIITAAYGQFIPSAVLDYPKFRCINAHGSLLPLYRGGAPIQRAIMNGDEKTGISIQYMAKKMDQGQILYQKAIDIGLEDTSSSMFEKLSDLALEMLLDFLPSLFAGNINPLDQKEEEASYAYNLEKELEHICFNEDVRHVYDHIRALLEQPGAYFIYKNKKFKMEKVSFAYDEDCQPSVFRGLEDHSLRIDCLNGYIKVYQIRPEGKNSMDARSFFNGYGRSMAGETLE